MAKIAILGSGNIGGVLARKWVGAGHDVVLGARDPEKSSVLDLAAELGVARATVIEAARDADVVLFAIPGGAMGSTVSRLGRALDDKAVIDAANNVGAGVAHSAQAFLSAAPKALYYRAFNTLGWELIDEPIVGGVQIDHFFCGPDGEARTLLEQLIADVGQHPVWIGGPEEVDVLDGFLRIWFTLALKRGFGRHIGFKLLV
jgi:predicted dinucleotide-binding enzyme